MSHPFSKLFEKALAKSRGDENVVLGEAEKLRERGYSPREIYDVLDTLKKQLIADADVAIVREALEEFGQYLEEPDSEPAE